MDFTAMDEKAEFVTLPLLLAGSPVSFGLSLSTGRHRTCSDPLKTPQTHCRQGKGQDLGQAGTLGLGHVGAGTFSCSAIIDASPCPLNKVTHQHLCTSAVLVSLSHFGMDEAPWLLSDKQLKAEGAAVRREEISS